MININLLQLKKFHNENIANNEFIDDQDYNIVLSVFKDLFINYFLNILIRH